VRPRRRRLASGGARRARGRLRIAVVSAYGPGYRDAGERVRLGALLDELSTAEDVTLLTWEPQFGPQDDNWQVRRPEPRLLRAPGLGPTDYARAAMTNSLVQWHDVRRRYAIRRWAGRELRSMRPDVVVAVQLGGAAAVPGALLGRTFIDTHNAEHLRWLTIAATQGKAVRMLARQQAAAAKRLERWLGRRVASMLAVTQEDAEYFSSIGAPTDVIVNGYTPPTTVRTRGELNPRDLRLLFVGSFSYSANFDALKWLAELVGTFPPGVKLSVVGSGDTALVETLFSTAVNVSVLGRVDVIGDVYAEHDVLVVPLKMGGGSRLKIIEGVAHGLAVVSTEIGAAGLPMEPGVHYLRAETQQDWHVCLARLISESCLHPQLVDAARDALSSMTWTAAGGRLRERLRSHG
jgi:polysaccharide biosynthesis protein PslH